MLQKNKYEIRVGQKFDYVEFGTDVRQPVEIINMFYDGFAFIIEFKMEGGGNGCTAYPEKLKQKE